MKTCPINYVEIPAPDLPKAKSFYQTVFGWKMDDSPLTGATYLMFESGDDGLSGGLTPELEVIRGGVLLYIKVEDIPICLEEIQKNQGIIVKQKSPIGDGSFGYFATFQDPNGNSMGIWSKT